MRRLTTLLTLVLVVSSLAVPAATVGATPTPAATANQTATPANATTPTASTATTATTSRTPTPTPTPTPKPSTTDGSAPTTTTPARERNVSINPPPDTMAGQVRVSPIPYDEDYMGATVTETDRVFNTTGPFAGFTTSKPVTAARIRQPGAEADVLDGSHTIHVNYADDAAPPGNTSLYQLELYFADGSSKLVRLYASGTDVDTAPAELQRAASFIAQMKEDAKEHGYPATIEGIEDYHQWEKEQADLLQSLFTEQLKRIVSIGLIILQTPLAIILGLLTIIAGSWWLLRKHKWRFEPYDADSNTVKRKRRELRHRFFEQMQTADQHHLRDVDEIGNQHTYWAEAFNVHSVKQLADLAAFGRAETDDQGEIVRDEDGNIRMAHEGVAELDVDTIHEDAWVQRVCRPYMLDPIQALAHMKTALQLMESKYEQGHRYRDARQKTTQLIDELQEGSHLMDGSLGTQSGLGGQSRSRQSGTRGGRGSSPAGGDD